MGVSFSISNKLLFANCVFVSMFVVAVLVVDVWLFGKNLRVLIFNVLPSIDILLPSSFDPVC